MSAFITASVIRSLKRGIVGALATLITATYAVAEQSAVQDTQNITSILSELATKRLLTDGQRLSNGTLVVVGDRGHILKSKDNGKSWQQVLAPTRELLTAVYFVDDQHGWAVGHQGVILHSADGGNTWQLQYTDPYNPVAADAGEASYNHGQPLLDVWFRDANQGFAIGAYGYFMGTTDGGKTWQDIADQLDNEDGWHLNTFIPGRALYIAGEAGTLFRSDDKGATWQKLTTPYEGSFFGGIAGKDDDSLLVFGLQGNLFYSQNKGEQWRKLKNNRTNSMMSGTALPGGCRFLIGNGGAMITLDPALNVANFALSPNRQSMINIINLDDGHALLLGMAGARMMKLPACTNDSSKAQ